MHKEDTFKIKGLAKTALKVIRAVPAPIWATISIAAFQQYGAPDLTEFAIDCAPDIIEMSVNELVNKLKKRKDGVNRTN